MKDVDTVLLWRAGPDLRGGQQRQGAHRRGAGGADADAGRGRTQGRRAAHLRQQTGETTDTAATSLAVGNPAGLTHHDFKVVQKPTIGFFKL